MASNDNLQRNVFRILWIDDEPSVLFLAELISYDAILDFGVVIELFPASEGNTAIRLLKEKDFDLVVTDFSLPGMTGAEIITLMHSGKLGKNKFTTVIVSTAAIPASLKRFPLHFLTKPFDFHEATILINRIFRADKVQFKRFVFRTIVYIIKQSLRDYKEFILSIKSKKRKEKPSFLALFTGTYAHVIKPLYYSRKNFKRRGFIVTGRERGPVFDGIFLENSSSQKSTTENS